MRKRKKTKKKKSLQAKQAKNKGKTKQNTKSTQAGFVIWQKDCHEDPTEIIPGLFIGSGSSAKDMAASPPKGHGVDVLVPLARLDGDIWDTGWRGSILYCPITDFRVLPEDVLHAHVEEVIRLLGEGKKVGIFCVGGHGRTGYMAAAILGRLYPDKDPIAFLRENYCGSAVESEEQIQSLARYLGRDDLLKHKATKLYGWGGWGGYCGGVYGLHDDVYTNGKTIGDSLNSLCFDCYYGLCTGSKVACSLDPKRQDTRKGESCIFFAHYNDAYGAALCPTCERWKGDKCSLFDSTSPAVIDCIAYDYAEGGENEQEQK